MRQGLFLSSNARLIAETRQTRLLSQGLVPPIDLGLWLDLVIGNWLGVHRLLELFTVELLPVFEQKAVILHDLVLNVGQKTHLLLL